MGVSGQLQAAGDLPLGIN